jgi:nucleoside phosphorylase
MILLSFAHRNEAQCFFEHFQFSSSQDFTGLWIDESEDLAILITGEGQFESLQILSSLLATDRPISKVINLGVAGALNSKLTNQEVYQVRTAYLSLENNPQFKSFPIQQFEHFKTCDCLTSSKRILKQETRSNLSPIADIVDRELWSLGFACSKAKVPLYAIKVISDSDNNDTKNICEEVKELAQEFSAILLQSFLAYYTQKSIKETDCIETDHPLYQLLNDKNLYFTVSMKRKFKTLISKIIAKNEDITKGQLIGHCSEDYSKKENALIVIANLTAILNPLRTEVETQLKELTKPLVKTGWTIKYDSNIEDKWISVSSKIQSPSQLHNLTKTLSSFPIEEWQDIFDGKSDV